MYEEKTVLRFLSVTMMNEWGKTIQKTSIFNGMKVKIYMFFCCGKKIREKKPFLKQHMHVWLTEKSKIKCYTFSKAKRVDTEKNEARKALLEHRVYRNNQIVNICSKESTIESQLYSFWVCFKCFSNGKLISPSLQFQKRKKNWEKTNKHRDIEPIVPLRITQIFDSFGFYSICFLLPAFVWLNDVVNDRFQWTTVAFSQLFMISIFLSFF